MEILSLLSLTFSLMKNLLLLSVVLAIVGVSSVSAATGSTSTGSTSTGSTSTGTTSTGVTSTGTVTVSVKWAGGPTRAWNYTSNSLEMVPQCFPWVWLLEYYKGNIFSMYENQNKCRAQRFVDFGL